MICNDLLVANVYLPTNYGDLDSLELYIDCLSKLQALIVDTNTAHVIVAGDFNCSVGSRIVVLGLVSIMNYQILCWITT